jgi:hypothetical protein
MSLTVSNVRGSSVAGRAAILMPLALAAWWFLLKGASLWALRVVAGLPLAMLIAPPAMAPIRADPNTGEWICNVEVNTAARDPRTGVLQHVNSIEIAFRPGDAAVYASAWFSYLALALAALPSFWRSPQRLLTGFALQTAVNTLAFVGYVYLIGYGTLINSPGSTDPRIWWVTYFDHINSLVIPFASPFLIAIGIYPQWRDCVGLPCPA